MRAICRSTGRTVNKKELSDLLRGDLFTSCRTTSHEVISHAHRVDRGLSVRQA